MEWEILLTPEVETFLDELYESDPVSHQLVNQAILVLERNGPAEGRPLVDTITASRIANMKELRPPSTGASEIRILLGFLHPSAGSARVLGHDVATEALRIRARTGYLPGGIALYDTLTGNDLLDYLAERLLEVLRGLLHLGVRRREDRGGRRHLGSRSRERQGRDEDEHPRDQRSSQHGGRS